MRIALVLLTAVCCQSVLAQPAVYKDQVLTIPQGAVIGTDDVTYFESIELQATDDGSFVLVAAEQRSLVYVDSVDVVIMESFPVQVSVTVSGNKSVPCVELLTPAISYKENTFTIALAESQLGPAETCIAVLDPFETTFALDVKGLAAGDYQVNVNGVTTEFSLQADN